MDHLQVLLLLLLLVSLFKNHAIASDISMTGEITLRGRVLPIGGLREKVIGSHRAGIRNIFLPIENKNDLEEIPDEVTRDIHFYLCRKL